MQGEVFMERNIAIKGKADMTVSPDYTTVVINLRENEKNYKKALEKLQEKTVVINKCVESVGIDTKDIKTTNYYAQAQKKMEKNLLGHFVESNDGYMCSQSVSIGFKTDPSLLGELLNKITDELEQPSISINFTIKDKKLYEEELLKKVTEDARKKAIVFCESSNATIGKLISVNYQRGMNWQFPSRPFVVPTASTIGNTEQLSISHPAAKMNASSAPSLPVPQPPVTSNITPQDKIVEEEAMFVWEIIDKE